MLYLLGFLAIISIIILKEKTNYSIINFHNSFSYVLDKNKPEDLEIIKKLIKHELKGRVRRDSYKVEANRQDIKFLMYKDQYMTGKLFEMASLSQSNKLRISSDMVIAPSTREHGLNGGKAADQLRDYVMKEYGIDLATMEDVVIETESLKIDL